MANKPKILAFAGSLREHSFNKRVLKIAASGARAVGAEVLEIDLRDYPLPIYNEDDQKRNGFDANAARLQKILAEHDGLLIASPEYNGSLPGGLKNAIDWASRQSNEFKTNEVFKGKFAAIMTASPGAFGGIRSLNHLRGVLTSLGVNTLASEIAVGKVREMFDGDGAEMKDAKMKSLLENLGAALADTLRKTHGEIVVASDTSR